MRLCLFRSVERVRRGRDRFRADDKRRCRRRLNAEQIAKLRVRGFVVMPALQREGDQPVPERGRAVPRKLAHKFRKVGTRALILERFARAADFFEGHRHFRGNGDIFRPADRDVVHAAVAAHDGDKFRMLGRIKGMRRNRDAVGQPVLCPPRCLQDALRLGVGGGKRGVPQFIGEHFRLFLRIVERIDIPINKLLRFLLPIQRQRQHGRKIEEHRLQVLRGTGDEIFPHGGEVVSRKTGRIDLRLPALRVFGADAVDAPLFAEGEIVAVAFVRFDQVEHIDLRQGRKEQAELYFVVTVGRAEQDVKLGASHFGEPFALRDRVARLFGELLFTPLDLAFQLLFV